MNNFEQFLLNELSKDLYQRAAKKAKKYQKGTSRMRRGHIRNAIKQGEHDIVLNQARKRKGTSLEGEESLDVVPNLDLSTKYDKLSKERKQQVGKFSAAAKGVKTKRPHRGHPLGPQQASLVKQSQIQIKRDKGENKGKDKGKDDDDPADYWKNENTMNNFAERLIRALVEGLTTGGSPSKTGERVGRALSRASAGAITPMRKKWTPRKTGTQLKAQTQRIAHKVSKRQAAKQALDREPGEDHEAQLGDVYAKAHERYRKNVNKGFHKGYDGESEE